MATIQDLEIHNHLDPFVLQEIPTIRKDVDFGDLVAATVAGCMAYLTREDRPKKGREYVAIVEGSATYNEKACFMTLKRKKHEPSVCARILYTRYKRFYAKPIGDPEVFKYVTNEIVYYGDYNRHATVEDAPYTIKSIRIIDEVFYTMFNRLKELQIVVTTFSRYALAYTESLYECPSIEVHRA